MKRKLWTLLLALGAALALCVGASAANGTKLETSHGGQTLSSDEYYLDGDVTISQTITVSGTVTLDLNGHVLQYKNDNTKGSVIVIENGGQLTIQDSDPDAPHKFDPTAMACGCWTRKTAQRLSKAALSPAARDIRFSSAAAIMSTTHIMAAVCISHPAGS